MSRRPVVLTTLLVCLGSGRAAAFSIGHLAVGGRHACAVLQFGFVSTVNAHPAACWGANEAGQASAPSGTFVQLAAGEDHSCGLHSDGTAVCWGDGADGETAAPPGTYLKIVAGDRFTCALRDDQTIACWGLNDVGQSAPPAGHFYDISAGWRFACGLGSSGGVTCWGDSSLGATNPPPSNLTHNGIAAGYETGCYLTNNLPVCWGDLSGPLASPPPQQLRWFSAGKGFFCGIGGNSSGSDFGPLMCWGLGNQGLNPPAGQFNEVGVGDAFGCAVGSTSGSVVCWGANESGQATSPVKCPVGSAGVGGVAPCSLCPSGTYSSFVGGESCNLCAPGFYGDAPGSNCQFCPAGTYSEAAGAITCLACAAGTYSVAGSAQCGICPRGTIAADSGTTLCTACPTNSIPNQNHTACVPPPVPAAPPWAVALLPMGIAGVLWLGRRQRRVS